MADDLFPLDLPSFFLNEIKKGERAPDGLLHPSGDLVGSLRHAQLRAAGAPATPKPIAQQIRLMHGTIWHEWFHAALEAAGVNFQYEVNVTPWLPRGWTGTADWLFWHPEYDAWVLGDLKTTKGEAIHWIRQDGAKKEHIWQLSAYYWALVASGRPMVHAVGVMYWPMNDTNNSVDVTPVMHEVEPIEEAEIVGVMADRWRQTEQYLASLEADYERAQGQVPFVNEFLAPEQEREPALTWNSKTKVFDVKLQPHWSTKFCDYPNYCDCSKQGITKIGHWDLDGQYHERGVEHDYAGPIPKPSDKDFRYRRQHSSTLDRALSAIQGGGSEAAEAGGSDA